MNFGQGLSSILHFRQYTLPNSEFGEKLTPENARIPMNLRQGIASHRGKEMLQVTKKAFEFRLLDDSRVQRGNTIHEATRNKQTIRIPAKVEKANLVRVVSCDFVDRPIGPK